MAFRVGEVRGNNQNWRTWRGGS
ncbi:unnamed protein product [Ectocarpus sp. CCAP 1310/34]|nr:unnamed protein product [Ectocarpus sp. CCAP 1310/34]